MYIQFQSTLPPTPVPCYWVCLNCPINKLTDNVASVPVAGHSRKIEASAHLCKILLRQPTRLLCQHRVCLNSEPVLPYLVTH